MNFKSHSVSHLIGVIVLSAIALSRVVAAEPLPLWNSEGGNLGGWRAFGAGMLEAKTHEDEGLALAVDWSVATFGVGAVFAVTGENKPSLLAGQTKLVVEAMISEASGAYLAPEWVLGGEGKEARVDASAQAVLTDEWKTYTFQIPGDFPKLTGSEGQVKALRLLFVNPEKEGRVTVYFRKARLEP